MNVNFSLPVTETKKTATSVESIHLGDIGIKGTVEFPGAPQEFPDITIDKIEWRGADILPLLDNLEGGCADSVMDYFTTAMVQHARGKQQEKQTA